MAVKNKVQLISYPDSFGGDIKTMHELIKKHFHGVLDGGVHILPPFPSSGDRGFAPLTYLEIDSDFGSWEDIRNLGNDCDVMLDLMVNHISRRSAFFQDVMKHGMKSEWADLFLTMDKINGGAVPSRDVIDKIFLRRTNPYSVYTLDSGEELTLWTTFGKGEPSEQVDLDVHSDKTRSLIRQFIENFSLNNVNLVRLDAVGYVIKKMGSSCFFVEPEIYDYLGWISSLADEYNIDLLPEVHAHYSIQYSLADHGFWIYDFILPYRILESLISGRGEALKEYLKERPHKQFTMLDCHDGLPVKPDLDGLMNTKEARSLVDVCLQRGSNLSLIYSEEHKDPDGFDVHQIRGTIYSMLDCNDDAYIAARALQFFTPGIPQVYYVGLLAGENDVEGVKERGDGREINRSNFSAADVESALEKDVVQRLMALSRFRNSHESFNGSFSVIDSEADTVILAWNRDGIKSRLIVNLETYAAELVYTDNSGDVKKKIL